MSVTIRYSRSLSCEPEIYLDGSCFGLIGQVKMWNFHDVSMSTRVNGSWKYLNILEHIFAGALFPTPSLWLYDICVSWGSWYVSCWCKIVQWLNLGFQFEAQHMQSENNEVPFSSGMNHHRRNARPQISYVNLSYVHKYLCTSKVFGLIHLPVPKKRFWFPGISYANYILPMTAFWDHQSPPSWTPLTLPSSRSILYLIVEFSVWYFHLVCTRLNRTTTPDGSKDSERDCFVPTPTRPITRWGSCTIKGLVVVW